MKNAKRILLAFLALLILGLSIAAISLNSIVEKLRPEIERQASQLLNTPVQVGQISSSLFPNIHVNLSDIKIGSGELSLKQASLFVALADLFRGNLKINAVTLDSLTTNIIREGNQILVGGIDIQTIGKANLRQNTAPTPDTPPSDQSKVDQSQSELAKSATTITVSRIVIRDADLTFSDRSGKSPLSLSIRNLDLEAHNIDLRGKAEISATANIFGATSPNLTISGSAGDPKKNFPLDLELRLSPIKMDAVMVLAKQFDGFPASLSLTNTASLKLRIHGKNDEIIISPELSLVDTGIVFSGAPGEGNVVEKKSGNPLTITGDIARRANDELSSDNLEIALGKNKLAVSFNRSPTGAISSSINSQQIQVADLAHSLPKVQTMTPVGSVNVALQLEATSSTSPKLNGTVDFSDFGAVAGGTALAGLKGQLAFAGETIALKDFSGAIRNIPLTGNATIQLPANSRRMVKLDNGLFGLFGGSVGLNATYSLPPLGSETHFANQISLSAKGGRFDAGAIFKSFLPDAPISLRGVIQSINTTLDATVKDIAQTMHGSSDFIIVDGAIEGLNVVSQSMAKATSLPGISKSLGELLPQVLTASNSEFKVFSGKTSINGPTILLSDLLLQHELYEIRGSGTVSTGGTAEIKSQVTLLAKLTSQMLAREKRLSVLLDKQGNMVFPVTISKTPSGVVVLPDFQQLVERAAGNVAKDAAGKALDKVAPGLGDATKGILDKLF